MAELKTPNKNAEQLITEHLDIWTTGIEQKSSAGRGSSKKFSLHGIKKLRELILELAVRGKLVPQDPNDEPASVLLERIADEKAQLIKDKKIKLPKALPEISEDEKPFEVPEGWNIQRLGNIGLIGSSSRVQKKDWQSDGVPFYRAREIVKLSSNGYVEDDLFITQELYTKLSEQGNVPEKGDLMITGVGTIGVPYIVTSDDKFYFKDASVLIFKNLANINSDYLKTFMYSPLWVKAIHEKSMGTTVHTLTIVRANEAIIPIPPEKEQQRIVAKVDELMGLCDALEAQTENSITAHQTLVEVLLEALLKAPEQTATPEQATKQFQQNWQRLNEHFDTLFTTTASIDTLKQTILQLAVMGKLVPQNPVDEPAAKLLERIAAEKAQLIKDKKIKKQKPLPEITDEEKQLELPNGWEWCRMGEVINLVSGQHLKPNEYSENKIEDGVPYITGPAEFGTYYPTYSKYTKEFRALANKHDILITCKGAGLGKLNRANTTIAISRQLMAIQSLKGSLDFLFLFVDSQYNYFQSKGVGIAIPGISRGDVEELVLMLPPLEEQHRIVAKVDELMTLCDQLKARLTDAQTTKLHLTDAIVEQA
ncbi:restriction endonuclease subunit S [Pseudoalteromonas sp. MIP2626]|uniref:restriction endonuclease subunit S n=1 Tax=Pseudoalteromonas sp. MIP2626 TaxID=2705464 RepID=UPI0015CCBAA9|nr:restriction endonuclease subunit S [Pseudoalteromonas sp. MIP2626]NYR13479.1 restriction endonuclease subunit S [Pseudoalteromonas sp. MIP2626]